MESRRDRVKGYADRYRDKINGLDKPFNIRRGWNLIEFNFDSARPSYYQRNRCIEVDCKRMYCSEFLGQYQPKDCKLNLGNALFERMCSLIQDFHKDNIPQLIHAFIFRQDKVSDKIRKKLNNQGIELNRGSITYLVGIVNSFYYNREINNMKLSGAFKGLFRYINHDK